MNDVTFSTATPAPHAGPAADQPDADAAVLLAVRHPDRVALAPALAWFAEAGAGRAVGFGYGPTRARWFRLDPADTGGRPQTSTGDLDLSEIYEVRVFDGSRELRWLQQHDGAGLAVVLTEARDGLPAGLDVSDPRRPRASGATRELLAGQLAGLPDNPSWSRLSSSRYAGADLPLPGPAGQRVVLCGVEYVVQDEHGNVSVTDVRLSSVQAVPDSDLRPPAHPRTPPAARAHQETSHA